MVVSPIAARAHGRRGGGGGGARDEEAPHHPHPHRLPRVRHGVRTCSPGLSEARGGRSRRRFFVLGWENLSSLFPKQDHAFVFLVISAGFTKPACGGILIQ